MKRIPTKVTLQSLSFVLHSHSEEDLMTMTSSKNDLLASPTTLADLDANARKDIAAGLNLLLADTFALYFKTKNFHWHVSGPHFRDYHLLLDEQADQILATIDAIAERVRKLGVTTLHSIGEVGRLQRLLDNEAGFVSPPDMLAELRDDNRQIIASMLSLHETCVLEDDVATTSLIETWMDDADRRVWILFETSRGER